MFENGPLTLQELLISLNSDRDELNRPLAGTGCRSWIGTELPKFSTEDKSISSERRKYFKHNGEVIIIMSQRRRNFTERIGWGDKMRFFLANLKSHSKITALITGSSGVLSLGVVFLIY
jgi:hypothetical protein